MRTEQMAQIKEFPNKTKEFSKNYCKLKEYSFYIKIKIKEFPRKEMNFFSILK